MLPLLLIQLGCVCCGRVVWGFVAGILSWRCRCSGDGLPPAMELLLLLEEPEDIPCGGVRGTNQATAVFQVPGALGGTVRVGCVFRVLVWHLCSGLSQNGVGWRSCTCSGVVSGAAVASVSPG